jgi:hypothetical protein
MACWTMRLSATPCFSCRTTTATRSRPTKAGCEQMAHNRDDVSRRSLADSLPSCPSSGYQPRTPTRRPCCTRQIQADVFAASCGAINDIAALILPRFISVKTQRGLTLSGQDPPQHCQGGRSARIVVTVACVLGGVRSVLSPGIGPMTSKVRARQQIAILQRECCYHTMKQEVPR